MSEEKYIAPDPIKKQLSKPEDFTPPDELFQQLIDTIRCSLADFRIRNRKIILMAIVGKAYSQSLNI